MNIEIANRLVALRKENGLSQEELASKIGISRQAVSKWERAEASPDTDNLILLARLYHISLDALLATDDDVIPREEDAPPGGEGPDQLPAVNDSGQPGAAGWGAPVERRGRRIKLARFPYPVLCVLLYLIIGFGFGLWHPGWLLFLTIPLYYWWATAMDHSNPD